MESQSALGQLVFLPGYFYLQNQVSQFLFLNHFADQICLQSKSFFEKENYFYCFDFSHKYNTKYLNKYLNNLALEKLVINF